MSIPAQPRAVVTGAGSGLGRAFCRELASRGAKLLLADINLDAARATAAEVGVPAEHAVACDVARFEDVQQLGDAADRLLGGVDLIINNAGVAAGGAVGEVPIEDWQWIVGINLMGVVHGCHVFVPKLRKQGSGQVINVASTAGLISAPMLGPYNATKSAVVALSETLHGELTPLGIGVSVLCPTFFQTNIAKSARATGQDQMQGVLERMMSSASIQAPDVARIALDDAQRGRLYILPHRDGRIMWLVKRLSPALFHRITPKLIALRARRAGLSVPK